MPTLALLGRPALRILAIGAETRKIPSGAVLYYAGDLADAGYLVQEGSFLLEPDRPGKGDEIIAGPGTLLGELALVTDTVHTATATAQESSIGDPHHPHIVSQDAGRLSGSRPQAAGQHGAARRRMGTRRFRR